MRLALSFVILLGFSCGSPPPGRDQDVEARVDELERQQAEAEREHEEAMERLYGLIEEQERLLEAEQERIRLDEWERIERRRSGSRAIRAAPEPRVSTDSDRMHTWEAAGIQQRAANHRRHASRILDYLASNDNISDERRAALEAQAQRAYELADRLEERLMRGNR